MAKEKVKDCLCGSGLAYDDCCIHLIEGAEPAATAEALMRSRYTAYVLGNAPYLLKTWHVSTRPSSLKLDEPPVPKWIGLKVLRHEQSDEKHAIVEFIARYKLNGRAYKLQETSRFVKEYGRWFYVDGNAEPGTP